MIAELRHREDYDSQLLAYVPLSTRFFKNVESVLNEKSFASLGCPN